MDFGKIVKENEDIELVNWSNLIAKHPNLEQAPDRTGTNPFTNEEVIFPGEGIAFYIENGQKIGNISYQNGTLLTTGVPLQFCNEVAVSLNAVASKDDRS